VTSFLSGKKHHIPVSAKILYIKLRFKHTINICENLRNLREKHSPEISPYQTTKKPLLLQRLSKSDPDWIRTNDPPDLNRDVLSNKKAFAFAKTF
jgi:hypothetical protein